MPVSRFGNNPYEREFCPVVGRSGNTGCRRPKWVRGQGRRCFAVLGLDVALGKHERVFSAMGWMVLRCRQPAGAFRLDCRDSGS